MRINVLEYLEHSVKAAPERIAFSDETDSVTFRQLMEKAKALGSAISALTNGITGSPIPVFVDRAVSDIISFMGVLYSGNFYVPIDSNMPPSRVNTMLRSLDSAASILTEKHIAALENLACLGTVIPFEKGILSPIDARELKAAREQVIDTDPVYTMFTSGSTGVPKGVVISHRAVIDLTEWLTETFSFSGADILGNQTPFYFDASVKDIYLTLKNASTTHILPKKLFAAPIRLIEVLDEKKINVLLWATSAVCLIANFDVFKKAVPSFLRKVFFAGEAMPAKQLNVWRKALPGVMFVNLYGPTEVTVDCTYYIVDRDFEDTESIPIGRRCRNMEVLLLDETGGPAGYGEIGEIYVRGSGIALGYCNDLEYSKERFIQNPLNVRYPELVYRTGDMAKYNAYGELTFVGRRDSQIKHMGNRIELGEIETAANAVRGVDAAACFYDQDQVKIVLICKSQRVTRSTIYTYLKDTLPRYMCPAVCICKTDMPMTPNGKIDRTRLWEAYKNEAD